MKLVRWMETEKVHGNDEMVENVGIGGNGVIHDNDERDGHGES